MNFHHFAPPLEILLATPWKNPPLRPLEKSFRRPWLQRSFKAVMVVSLREWLRQKSFALKS